jgi:hypothetical protein
MHLFEMLHHAVCCMCCAVCHKQYINIVYRMWICCHGVGRIVCRMSYVVFVYCVVCRMSYVVYCILCWTTVRAASVCPSHSARRVSEVLCVSVAVCLCVCVSVCLCVCLYVLVFTYLVVFGRILVVLFHLCGVSGVSLRSIVPLARS